MPNLTDLPKGELLEVWNTLNDFEWDNRLGSKPLGFDEMPIHDKNSLFCKYKTLSSYMDVIRELTTEKERLKHHHLNNLNRNRMQFQWWWIKRNFRVKLMGQAI